MWGRPPVFDDEDDDGGDTGRWNEEDGVPKNSKNSEKPPMRPSIPYDEYGDMDDEIMQVMSRGRIPSRSSVGEESPAMGQRPESAQASYNSSGKKKNRKQTKSDTPSDVTSLSGKKKRSRSVPQPELIPTRVAFTDSRHLVKVALVPLDCSMDVLHKTLESRLSVAIHSIIFQCDTNMVVCCNSTIQHFNKLLPRPVLLCVKEESST